MQNKKLRLIIGGIISSLLVGVFANILTLDASAASDPDAVYKKTLLNALKTCYSDEYMKEKVPGTDYSNISSLMAGSQGVFNSASGSKGFKDGVIRVPSQYGNTLDDANMSCYQVFSGWRQNKSTNSAKGLLSLYGKTLPESELPNFGYKKNEVSTSGGYRQGCFSFTYTAPNGTGGSRDYKTNEICVDVDSDNNIDVLTNAPVWGDAGDGEISLSLDANYFLYINGPGGLSAFASHSLYSGGGESWDVFKQEFQSAAGQIDGWIDPYSSNSLGYHLGSINATLGNEDHYAEYRRTKGDAGATEALRYFAGAGKTWGNFKFDDDDRYALYTTYIERVIQDANYPSIYIGSGDKCSKKLDDAKKETGYAYRKDKATWCPLYGVDAGPQLNGMKNDTTLEPKPFKDIVTEMMKSKYDSYGAEEGSNPIGTPDPDSENPAEQENPCSKAGEALGWIICPVVQLFGGAVEKIYENIEANFLQIDPKFMDGTEAAWESFRDWANIIFAIVFVVIIISQITGFGVSNYGIKKMLPTLIVVAVLVNISFFLCKLAVDISNISGYGLREAFLKIPTGVTTHSATGDADLGSIIGGLVKTVLTGVGTVIGVKLAFGTWEFWLPPLLLALLTAFISVLFFFAILGVRQGALIVLVAFAPVAIICYALPNTKKVFERWWKIFVGLLMVYPICGALMGGGQFASRLMLAAGSAGGGGMTFSYAFVAVLLQAVPFFFVPSILKSSFAAMGNIGNKLSALGSRFGGGISGAIKKSDGYKDTQERLRGNNAQRALGREEWNQRHRILGAAGRLRDRAGAKIRSGNGRLAKMATNSYNRRQNRLQGTVLAQNLANRDRTSAFSQRHVNELAKDYTDTWENDGTFAEEKTAAAQLNQALTELRGDSENVDARARFTSAMHNLNASDTGRQYVDSVLNGGVLASAQAGETQNAGIKWAASAVRNAAGGEYKAKNPSTFKNLNQLASGEYKYNASDIISTKDGKGNEFFANKDYLYEKAQDIGAEQLMNTDDGYRRAAIAGLASGAIAGDNRNNLIAQAREVMNNSNLNPKGDVARDMDKIANMSYAPPSGSTSNNTSVNTVDNASIRSMANANQGEYDRIIRGIENGTIRNDAEKGISDRTEIANVAEATLNAANAGTISISQESANNLNRIRALDGRAEIPYAFRVQHNSASSAPVPSGYRESASGFVVPNGGSGDRTGSQIRDFAEQVRQHNNNNGRNGGGPTIIRP